MRQYSELRNLEKRFILSKTFSSIANRWLMADEYLQQPKPTNYDQSPEAQTDGPWVDNYGVIYPAGKPYVDEYGTIHPPGTYKDRNGVWHRSANARYNPRTGAFELIDPSLNAFGFPNKNSPPPIRLLLNSDPNSPKLRAPKPFTFDTREKDTDPNAPKLSNKQLREPKLLPLEEVDDDIDPNKLWGMRPLSLDTREKDIDPSAAKPKPDQEIAQVAEPIIEPITNPSLKHPGSGDGREDLSKYPPFIQEESEKIQQGIENGIDQLNPLKSDEEKKALRDLTDRQKKGFKKSQHHDELKHATQSTRNDKGCTFVDLNKPEPNPVRSMIIDAMTGTTTPTLVIDPMGQAAEFDGSYKGSTQKDLKRLQNKLVEVEALSPQNAAQESADRAFIRSKLAEWQYQGAIANRCGCELLIKLPNADLVQFANQNLKLSPGIRIQEAKLGGTYRQVRDNTVGGQVHHMPADSVSPLSTDMGPAIWMEIPHHRGTASHDATGRTKATAYRNFQKKLIQSGQFDRALKIDINDVNSKFPGLYDISIKQMMKNRSLKNKKSNK
jgi:hypothetical protein